MQKSLPIWNSFDFEFCFFDYIHLHGTDCTMSQARHTASRLLPVVGITTAGVAASAAGLWAWRGRIAVPENRSDAYGHRHLI